MSWKKAISKTNVKQKGIVHNNWLEYCCTVQWCYLHVFCLLSYFRTFTSVFVFESSFFCFVIDFCPSQCVWFLFHIWLFWWWDWVSVAVWNIVDGSVDDDCINEEFEKSKLESEEGESKARINNEQHWKIHNHKVTLSQHTSLNPLTFTTYIFCY